VCAHLVIQLICPYINSNNSDGARLKENLRKAACAGANVKAPTTLHKKFRMVAEKPFQLESTTTHIG
jgi:hypothetical protein